MILRLTLAQDWNWSDREEVIVVEWIFISAPLMNTTINKMLDLFSEKTKKIKRLRTNNQCWLLMKTTANRRTVICLLQREITSCCCNAHILTWGLVGDLGFRWRFGISLAFLGSRWRFWDLLSVFGISLAFLGPRWCFWDLIGVWQNKSFSHSHTLGVECSIFSSTVCNFPESGFWIV